MLLMEVSAPEPIETLIFVSHVFGMFAYLDIVGLDSDSRCTRRFLIVALFVFAFSLMFTGFWPFVFHGFS